MNFFETYGIPLITLFLGTILGNFISFHNKSRELQDSLDARSNWRVNLVNIASKENINLDDVYRLRAALRNVKHDSIEVEPYSFDFMTNVIINICEDTVRNCDCQTIESTEQDKIVNRYLTNDKDCEIIRICCRFLLKHQWEYLTKNYQNPIVRIINLKSKINNNAEDVCEEIKENGGKINYV